MKRIGYISTIVILLLGMVAIFQSCKKKPTIPSLTTAKVIGITRTSAITGGNITDDGGAEITGRGVCWGTSQNPTLSSNKTNEGVGSGPFISKISDLLASTIYYARAYASNSEGTGYGNEVSFTTSPISIATVTTAEVSKLGSTYAFITVNILDDGGGIDLIGACWSMFKNPTLNNKNIFWDYLNQGSISFDLTGLLPKTVYYICACALNEAGIAYGNQVSFTTMDGQIIFKPGLNYSSVSDIDGNDYKTVQIGTQTWMAENLKTTRYSDGTQIQLVAGDDDWAALSEISKSFCYYDDTISSANDLGALYTWAAAMNGANTSSSTPSGVQGACPTGWHLPSYDEWSTLMNYLGGSHAALIKMKETGYSHWIDNYQNTTANNESGFTALPVGFRSPSRGDFESNAYLGCWWSSTEMTTAEPWFIGLYAASDTIGRYYGSGKKVGYSVRCLKD